MLRVKFDSALQAQQKKSSKLFKPNQDLFESNLEFVSNHYFLSLPIFRNIQHLLESNLGNHFAVSRSGLSANSLTYPKHKYATGTTCSGKLSVSFRISFDKILTQPNPTPSVLADNHKF